MTLVLGIVAVFIVAGLWMFNEWRVFVRDRRVERLVHRNLTRGGLL